MLASLSIVQFPLSTLVAVRTTEGWVFVARQIACKDGADRTVRPDPRPGTELAPLPFTRHHSPAFNSMLTLQSCSAKQGTGLALGVTIGPVLASFPCAAAGRTSLRGSHADARTRSAAHKKDALFYCS